MELKKEKLKTSVTSGVGGIKVKTWEFKLPLKIGKRELLVNASAVYLKENSMPLLLGRKDIFEDRFNLLLDSKNKVVVIEENEK